MTEYDDHIKQLCWTTYWEGFKAGRDVERHDAVTKRTARSLFERWWRRNTNE
jgi:hypothetical protein